MAWHLLYLLNQRFTIQGWAARFWLEPDTRRQLNLICQATRVVMSLEFLLSQKKRRKAGRFHVTLVGTTYVLEPIESGSELAIPPLTINY